MACMQALYDAADDDSATGGPDMARRIYPIVVTVTADGYQRLSDEETGSYAQAVVAERMHRARRPDLAPAPARAAESRVSPPVPPDNSSKGSTSGVNAVLRVA